MHDQAVEPSERRRVKYLELAAEALRAAGQSSTSEMRKAYLSIAYSWLDLASDSERGTP